MHLNKIILLLTSLTLVSCSQLLKNKEILYKAYVINLDRAQHRLEFIKKQFNKHNIPFERFKAVDGYKIQLTDLETGENFTGQDLKNKNKKLIRWKKYYIDCGIDPRANFIYYRTKDFMLSAGELGCTCSHRGVILDAIDKKLDVIVVFEDDVKILSDNFAYLFYNSLNLVPKNGIIYMDAHGPSIEHLERNKNIIELAVPLKNISKLFGFYAVIYDIETAKQLLEHGNYEDRAIDDKAALLISKNKIKGFILNKKSITFEHNLGSDIKEMGRPH